MIEITEKKRNKLSEYAEKMLRYGGKLMQCLEDLDEESDIGHRDEESGYRKKMGNRKPDVRRKRNDDWDDDDDY